jgi:adenosylhomocysteine nucleosidase
MELRGKISAERALVVVAVAAEADELDTELPVLITGVGKLAAALGILQAVGQLAPERRPAELLNLGTAGALHDHLEGLHVIGTVRQHDLDGPSIERLTGVDPSPELRLGDGPVLASGDVFVADPEHRARLASEADLCDMEGYAVAAAAQRLEVRVTLVKHVSDAADEEAPRNWPKAVAESSAALGAWLASRTTLSTAETRRG